MPGINELLAKSVKKYGYGVVQKAENPLLKEVDYYRDYPRLCTDIFPLDFALAGGIPFNVPVQIWGPESGGKTTLGWLIAKSLSKFCCNPDCLKPIGLCKCSTPKIQKTMYISIGENVSLDSLWVSNLGYDMDNNLVVSYPEHGEMACTILEDAVAADDCGLIIVDSLAGFRPQEEFTNDYGDGAGGLRQAALISKMFARLSNRLVTELKRNHLVAVVFINQVRAKIGNSFFGPSETTSGGHAARHAFRLSLRINQVNPKSEEKEEKDGIKDMIVFNMSTLGTSGKQQILSLAGTCQYKLCAHDTEDWTSGKVVDWKTVYNVGKQFGIVEKKSNSYQIKNTDIQFSKLNELEDIFRTNETLAAIIRYSIIQQIRDMRIKKLKESAKVRFDNIVPGNGVSKNETKGAEEA